MADKKVWLKEKMTGTPQLTTAGGIGGLVYQLSQILANVQFGGFIASLKVMTYGAIISAFSPLILFIIMILFNETDWINKNKKDVNEE